MIGRLGNAGMFVLGYLSLPHIELHFKVLERGTKTKFLDQGSPKVHVTDFVPQWQIQFLQYVYPDSIRIQ